MKKLTAILLAAAMLFGLAACAKPEPTPSGSGTPAPSQTSAQPGQTDPATGASGEDYSARYGGHVNIRVASAIQWLDPTKASGSWRYIYTTAVFENALTRDAENNIAPCVCDYELSPDGLKLTLWVREGVKFSNGDPVDIYDVEASLKRFLAVNSNGKSKVAPLVASMTVDSGKLTLVFSEYVETTMSYLASYETWAGIIPREICDKYPEDAIPNEEYKNLIGTGPYKYDYYEQDMVLEVVKVPGYEPREEDRDKTGSAGIKYGFVDSISFLYNSDDSSAAMGLLNGDYDAGDVMPEDYREMAAAAGIVRTELPSNLSCAIMFNVDGSIVDGKPVNVTAKYPSLRKAVMAAIDYEEFLEAVNEGAQVMGGSPWTTEALINNLWVEADYYGPTNMDAVKKYLEAAKAEGWDGVEPVRAVRSASQASVIPTMWRDYLTKAGIPNEIQVIEKEAAAELNKAGAGNNFDMLFYWPNRTATPVLQATQYVTFWKDDPEKNRLIEEMKKYQPDSQEYIRLARQYDEYLIDKCGAAFMCSYCWFWFNNGKLQFNDQGMFRYVYNMYWEDPANHPKK